MSSPAFGATHLAPTDTSGTAFAGTATVAKSAGLGTLPVKIVADYGDTGAQTTAGILVNTGTTPDPAGRHGTATVAAHTKPGYYRVDGYVGNQKVDSVKFGVADSGTVHHRNRQQVVIHHRATPVKHHSAAPVSHLRLAPVKYREAGPVNVGGRGAPPGAVNAGATVSTAATAATADSGLNTGLTAGASGLSVAVLLGGTVLWRHLDRS